MLGVSLRTIGHWETGQTRVPYAAFKLLRIYRHGEFLHPAWQGYALIRGKLVTPENHELHPGDLSWLSLLHRRAEFGDQARAALRALDARFAPVAESGRVAAGSNERVRRLPPSNRGVSETERLGLVPAVAA